MKFISLQGGTLDKYPYDDVMLHYCSMLCSSSEKIREDGSRDGDGGGGGDGDGNGDGDGDGNEDAAKRAERKDSAMRSAPSLLRFLLCLLISHILVTSFRNGSGTSHSHSHRTRSKMTTAGASYLV